MNSGIIRFVEKNRELQRNPKDFKISRIFRLSHFIDLLKSKELLFIKPELWDDPLENLFLKKSDNKIRWSGTNLFGLCWTDENDGCENFEKYLPNDIGVRVYSNLNTISDAIVKYNRVYKLKDFYSGKVDYYSKEIVEGFIKSDFVKQSNSSSDTAFMRSMCLFIKDDNYVWEKEVRIVIENQEGMRSDSKTFGISINLKEFVEKIEFDPRMSSKNRERIKKILLGLNLSELLN